MRALLTAMAILGLVLTCALAAPARCAPHHHPMLRCKEKVCKLRREGDSGLGRVMYDHVESTLGAWVPVPIDALDLRKT